MIKRDNYNYDNDNYYDASVVHVSDIGHLLGIPPVAKPRLSPGKTPQSAMTTMGTNDLVIDKDHLLGQSYQRQTGRRG